MGLSNSAIIVIVLVACLAVTAMGAALFRHYNPLEDESRYNVSHEQGHYMRTVRMRNFGFLQQESMRGVQDLESRCTCPREIPIFDSTRFVCFRVLLTPHLA